MSVVYVWAIHVALRVANHTKFLAEIFYQISITFYRFLADDNLLWKEQCRRIGITTLKKMPRSLPRCESPWKAAYMRQYLIENNWLHKPVNAPIVMRGHDDHVITCLQFYGNRILSGSDDTTLKVWSAVTGKVMHGLNMYINNEYIEVLLVQPVVPPLC